MVVAAAVVDVVAFLSTVVVVVVAVDVSMIRAVVEVFSALVVIWQISKVQDETTVHSEKLSA